MKSNSFSMSGSRLVSHFFREMVRRLRFQLPGSADRALARAIDEGMQSETVSRDELIVAKSTPPLNEFFMAVSESSLDKIWDNTEDDVYEELLED